ncbi:hypothetical protein B0J17DRAFT_773342 [Rhizoctonia solani]|nr:hypothetical protein B0J17DRAFT_773342 [Rhizoctonia solani]
MNSSRGSKPLKRIRGLMDRLAVSQSRSRLQSPSQSSHQSDPGTLTPADGPSKDTSFESKAGPATSQSEAPSAITQTTNPLIIVDSELGRAESKIPTVNVMGPIGEDQNRSPDIGAPGVITPWMNPPDPSQWAESTHTAWTTLRRSLRFVHNQSSGMFPTLHSAVGILLACIDGLEAVSEHREDYEELAATLSAMSDSLLQCMKYMSLSDSILNLARSIEREALEIQEKLGKIGLGGIRDASMREEELMRHYRRVQSLFQRIQARQLSVANAGLSTWRMINEQLARSWLEELNPVKQAEYDSDLSTEISRRSCTEGTRTAIIAGLNDWLNSSASASTYWMNGMAGTGKTTIAYSFCEEAEKCKQLVASFFCTRNSVELKDSMPDNLVVVIDALDECESQKGVEIILDMLFRYAGHIPLKVLIISRPEPEIYKTSLVRADIELYLREELAFMSPTPVEIEQLAHRSGCLFIYAATLKHAEIDAPYSAVLHSALQEAHMEDQEAEDIKAVLRTVLFAQEPIDVKTIAVLSGLDGPEQVIYALQPLRSVIYQSEETGLVSNLHASFPDFLLSFDRQLLAQRCFEVMKKEIKFNIYALESSFVPDEQIGDLQDRIKANIPSTLACVAGDVEGVSISATTVLDGEVKSLNQPNRIAVARRITSQHPNLPPTSISLVSPSALAQASLIDHRGSAALASWKGGKFMAKAFSSDGTQVIGGDQCLAMAGSSAHAFSSDGSRAVSVLSDGTIRIWDAYHGTLVSGVLTYDTSHIRSLD